MSGQFNNNPPRDPFALIEMHRPLIRRAYDHFEQKGWEYTDNFFLPSLEGMTRRGVTAYCQPTPQGVRLDVVVPSIVKPFDEFAIDDSMHIPFAKWQIALPTDDVGYGVNQAIAKARSAWMQLDYLRHNPVQDPKDEIAVLNRLYRGFA